MDGYLKAVAVLLLTCSPGTVEPNPPDGEWPAYQAELHRTAIQWEIMDPRETRYVLARVEDYQGDLDLLRRRFQELRDAPPAADSLRFPDRKTVNELVRFNRAYRKHLADRQALETDRAASLLAAIAETDRLYAAWDAARDSRCEFYYVTVRRQALKKLRDEVGRDAYDRAELPPYVPEWRFVEVK